MEKELSLFILGMPRSGTKLFRELLNNHGDIFIPSIETEFIPNLFGRYGNRILDMKDIRKLTAELKKSLFFFYYEQNHYFDFSKVEIPNITLKKFIDLFFVELARQEGNTAPILGDKSPSYLNDIELLQLYYPNAKFILLIRDPRDYVLSMQKAWGKNMYRAAYRWNQSMQIMCKQDNDRILEIRYEKLINSPELVLNNVCTFLKIPYTKEMMVLTKSVENLGDTKSQKGIIRGNSGKFKNRLTAKQLLKIEALAFDSMEHYNYTFYSNVRRQMMVSKFNLERWKILDGLNWIKFNIQENGIFRGIEKVSKSQKNKGSFVNPKINQS